jgi:hypothetical protein
LKKVMPAGGACGNNSRTAGTTEGGQYGQQQDEEQWLTREAREAIVRLGGALWFAAAA